MIYGAYGACGLTIYMQSETEIEREMELESITIYDVISSACK